MLVVSATEKQNAPFCNGRACMPFRSRFGSRRCAERMRLRAGTRPNLPSTSPSSRRPSMSRKICLKMTMSPPGWMATCQMRTSPQSVFEHKLLCELIGQSRTEENVSEVSNSSGLEQFGPPKPKPRAWIELFLVCYFRRISSFAPAVGSSRSRPLPGRILIDPSSFPRRLSLKATTPGFYG